MKLATAAQMRACDNTAIEKYSIAGLDLMENAGVGTVEAMAQYFGPLNERAVTILVGPGNNGGDGLVIARALYDFEAEPQVIMLVADEKLTGDAAVNLERAKVLDIPFSSCLSEADIPLMAERLAQSDIVVDSVFGTGLTREVSGHFALTIEVVNQLDMDVVAVDIPSGLNSDTGKPLGICVNATLTCTYGLAKAGQFLGDGPAHVGAVLIIDIGIPDEAVADVGVGWDLLEDAMLNEWLVPRGHDSHKGTFGHLLVLAGATGKSGAALLTARGALRCGVGLVSCCVAQNIHHVFESALAEAMSVPLSFSDDFPVQDDFEMICLEAAGKNGVALGPGIGQALETVSLVQELYKTLGQPMVVDADGLNCLAQDVSVLKQGAGPRILTPHPGEMARLTGLTTAEVQADRQRIALEFAEKHGLILVLKGNGTVIAAPDGRLAINATGNPGMATGGMGDVLTGLIGGLLAQGVEPWQAACLGVYLHGRAADRIVAEGSLSFGYLASEVADELPQTFHELANT